MFKNLRAMRSPPRAAMIIAQCIVLLMVPATQARASGCIAPERPFMPTNPDALQDYADILRRDFELYIRDIQGHFRCLDEERARAFEEARQVSSEYEIFLETVDR